MLSHRLIDMGRSMGKSAGVEIPSPITGTALPWGDRERDGALEVCV